MQEIERRFPSILQIDCDNSIMFNFKSYFGGFHAKAKLDNENHFEKSFIAEGDFSENKFLRGTYDTEKKMMILKYNTIFDGKEMSITSKIKENYFPHFFFDINYLNLNTVFNIQPMKVNLNEITYNFKLDNKTLNIGYNYEKRMLISRFYGPHFQSIFNFKHYANAELFLERTSPALNARYGIALGCFYGSAFLSIKNLYFDGLSMCISNKLKFDEKNKEDKYDRYFNPTLGISIKRPNSIHKYKFLAGREKFVCSYGSRFNIEGTTFKFNIGGKINKESMFSWIFYLGLE